MHLNLESDTMVVARSSKRNQGSKGVASEVVELIYRSGKTVPCDVSSVPLQTIRINDYMREV